MKNIFDLQFSDIQSVLKNLSEPDFRSKQIWQGIYCLFTENWQDITNLPKSLREHLQENFILSSLKLEDESNSLDNLSTKYLFRLQDGNLVESVILRSRDRITLCISTQSGCPVGCVFCATGKLGYFRNLSSGEIIEQVIYLSRLLNNKGEHLTNIVIMGMGEPFLNYDATITAVKRFNDKDGMNIGARRITISTIGIPERILQFADENLQVNLAISLHAPNDVLRRELVPIAKKIRLSALLGACRQYVNVTHRRVTFEYVMVAGVNDHPEQAEELAKLLNNLLCHVNLIGLNPTNHYSGRTPSRKTMEDFEKILLANNIATSIRNSQGTDIQAACGQLAGKLIHSTSTRNK